MKFSLFKSSKSSKTTTKKKDAKNNSSKTMAAPEINNPVVAGTGRGRYTHSPTHSISSASTQSSLQTINQQETRGIFRTLEPVWSFLPDHHDQWVTLTDENQRALEHALNTRQSSCPITLSQHPHHPPITTRAYFASKPKAPAPPSKKKRPVTQFFTPPSASSLAPPTTHHPQQNRSSPNLRVSQPIHRTPGTGTVPALPSSPLQTKPSVTDGLYLHQNLRRALVPYWWFEQENQQMARFDYKNQVRLEALSDGRSTLTLTDASFPVPFQVILEQTDRSLREECCGFMYISTPLILQHQLQQQLASPKYTYDPLAIQTYDDDDELYHEAFLNRRSSI